MAKIHEIQTQAYAAKISAYANKVLKIAFEDGMSHTPSGALLPQNSVESDFMETPEKIFIKAEEFTVELGKTDGNIVIYNAEGRELLSTYPGISYTPREAGGFELGFWMTPDQQVYGLGQDNDVAFGRLNRRGTVRDMLTGQRINQSHVTADFPIPFLLCTGGNAPFGIYLDNTSNLTVDIGKTKEDLLHIKAPAGAPVFWVILGDSVKEIVEQFSSMTGRAKLPPLWVLGYMQSKCSFWNWEEMDDVILTFEEKGIPLDCMVFDFDWAEYLNNYQWAARWEGKSPEKIKYYQETYGIHFMASNSGPMLKKNSDTFESALEAGVLARDTEGNTVTCGHYSGELMDFTNPKTEEWIAPQLQRIMEDGVEAWWLDLTEPEGDAENTVYHAGSRAEVHNIFSNAVTETYHHVMQQANPGKRSFVLTRTGTAGIWRNPTALWTGDIYSEYETLQAHIPEALNSQLCGLSMWTCDTGGFLSPTNNEACPYNLYHNDRTEHGELFERWMQFSCFTPIYRAHHAGGEAVPFRYQDITMDGMAHYIQLRYRLIPYIYSLYYENFLHGTPIMRPLFFHYPEDKKAYQIVDEYLFGEHLLVAPVLEAQTCTRKVYFPEGTWYDFDYDYVYEGGQEYEVYAPQNRIPVFVKAGGIIPMAKPVTHTKDLDMSRLEACIYPHGTSVGYVYADDGVSEDYVSGGYTVTKITCEETENVLKVSLENNNHQFALKEFTANIHMSQVPQRVMFAGKELVGVGRLTTMKRSTENNYYFDAFNRMLHIKVFLEAGEGEVEIFLQADQSYRSFEPFSMEKLEGQLPYIYPPASIPCMIHAIHYDRGGESVAYHKNNPDTRGLYRDDNAGIAEVEGGYVISPLTAGEWLEYSLSSAKEGNYRVVLEGDTSAAVLQVTIEGSFAEIENETAVLSVGTGQKILRIDVKKGSAMLSRIRIEAI